MRPAWQTEKLKNGFRSKMELYGIEGFVAADRGLSPRRACVLCGCIEDKRSKNALVFHSIKIELGR